MIHLENNRVETIGNQTLIHGECLEVMDRLEDKSVDLILCDLPFGVSCCSWDIIIPFDKLWDSYNRVIKDNGAIVLFGIEPFSTNLRLSNIKNYKYDWIWIKNQSTNFHHAKRMPLRKTENISVFYATQPTYNPQKSEGHIPTSSSKGSTNGKLYSGESKRDYKGGDTSRFPTNILEFKCVNNYHKKHPNEKPVELLEYLIKTYTNEGDLVLDNCAGSFSTLVACQNTNRNGIGIEMDENYYNIGVDRVRNNVKVD